MAMRYLPIDFVSRAVPGSWFMLPLFSAGCLLFAYQLHAYFNLKVKQASNPPLISKVNHKAFSKPAIGQSGNSKQLIQQMRNRKQVADRLNTPWNLLLSQIEGAGAREIALLSISSDMAHQTIEIGGEARDMEALLHYVDRLHRNGVYTNVQILTNQPVMRSPTLLFTVEARWGHR